MNTLKGFNFQLDQFSSPTHSITQAVEQAEASVWKVRVGALNLLRSRTSLTQCRLIMKVHLALQCNKIFTYMYSASISVQWTIFIQLSHIDCSELVIVGELFCRLSETPSTVKSIAAFKGDVDSF